MPSKPSFNSQIHYVAIASEALLSVTHHAILNLMHERGGVNGTSILDDLLPLVDALSSSTIEYCRISLSESVSLSPVKLKQLRSYPLLKPDPSKEVSRIRNCTLSPCYSRTNTSFPCMQLSRLIWLSMFLVLAIFSAQRAWHPHFKITINNHLCKTQKSGKAPISVLKKIGLVALKLSTNFTVFLNFSSLKVNTAGSIVPIPSFK